MNGNTRGRGANVRSDSALYIGDAPDGMLGARGALGDAHPIGYAWCERERAYHFTTARRGEVNVVSPGRWTERVAQPVRTVRVVFPATDSANVARIRCAEFADAYDAQRSHLGVCIGTRA